MEGVRYIATAYYHRSNVREKESVEAFFRRLDMDGDGRLSLADLKRSVPAWISNKAVFRELDEDGDGLLDFSEVVAVHYMVNKADLMLCSGCATLLSGAYFSCLLCLDNGEHTFDLCCACYSRGAIAHQHSASYLLDHHSLLGVFRRRATEAEKSQRKKEMEELQEIAMAHYRAASVEVQSLAHAFYQSMDTDGDGKVNLMEFLALMSQEGYSHIRARTLFSELDQDGNGTLNFLEVITLYYIMKSARSFCDECGHFIPGIFFSCVMCFKSSPKMAFNLCCDCYQSSRCNHNHSGRSQFLDNYTLLEATRNLGLA